MKNLFSSSLLTMALVLGMGSVALAQKPALPRTVVAAGNATDEAPKPAPAPQIEQVEENDNTNIVLFTGTVKQEKLKALPGATIYVKSTKQMAVANEDGDFSLELDFSNGPVDLDVSYAGFEDQNVTISDPNLFMVVQMAARKKK